jgi:hypothetical protein
MTISNTAIKAMEAYVCAIRNSNKKAYARAYKIWLLETQNDNPAYTETYRYESPNRNLFKPLSSMAAQAVEIQLNEILNISKHLA